MILWATELLLPISRPYGELYYRWIRAAKPVVDSAWPTRPMELHMDLTAYLYLWMRRPEIAVKDRVQTALCLRWVRIVSP